ncbi:MAG: DUF2828 family protein [Clostridia bacterium]|nr:DUF2828 family protein [Clostridia bacterium]
MLNALTYEANRTYTENGAVTHRSSGSDCLDFFAVCGALRHADENEIVRKFLRAYAENPDTAMKTLFYARDIRGGLGERRLFRCILRYLAYTKPSSVLKNLPLIAEYGRFDDLLILLGSPCEDELIRYLRAQLDADLAAMEAGDNGSLLAKWLPSVNTSSHKSRETAKKLCHLLGMREKEYRQTLAKLRAHIDIVESRLCRKDYTFDYGQVPAGALFKYREALLRNDGERYKDYLTAVREGRAKMNTGTLYPYQIVRSAMKEYDEENIRSLDTTWNALPDCCNGRNALAVIDGSGSMYCDYGTGMMPATVALSLGIYFAEHNTGRFADRFITFSQTPRFVKIKGDTIAEKVRYCMSFDECANTNLYEVFRLILHAAVRYNIPQEELPELLYIISDMEFDAATGGANDTTVHRKAKKLYDKYGYKLPQVVYWNVCSRNEQVPVTMNESGTALVSGSSPILFRHMMEMDITPFTMMEQILGSERYAPISA